MAVMLMVVFYFSMKLTVGSMEKKLTELYPIKNQVVILDKSVGDLKTRMAKIEQLPKETRRMIYENILNELTQKAEYLSNHLKGQDKEKLVRIQNMLKEIEDNMVK